MLGDISPTQSQEDRAAVTGPGHTTKHTSGFKVAWWSRGALVCRSGTADVCPCTSNH